MHCNANQRSPFANPIPIEFVMSTGRYTRICTRQHSDPLFPPHPSRNAFAIALTHSTIYPQQHSIHRFAESWDGSNLHSTPLHSTFNYINAYYNLHTHQRCLESHFHSESPTARFTIISSNLPSTLHPSTLITTPSLFSPLFTFLDLRK